MKPPVNFDTIRRLALALRGVEEYECFGTPAFRVGKKLLARIWEDGETLVVKMDFETRDFMMQASPEIYYLTDHYRNYPNVLIRLPAVTAEELREQLESGWRMIATTDSF